MRVVIQRVAHASVAIEGKVKSKIEKGFLILLGVSTEDTAEDMEYLCQKIVKMRIFNDEDGKMNLSIQDINGDILLISQFTLYAQTHKGNRPSFIRAARPEKSLPMYEQFAKRLEELLGKPIGTGEFGAEMKVELLNDGPTTVVMDTVIKDF